MRRCRISFLKETTDTDKRAAASLMLYSNFAASLATGFEFPAVASDLISCVFMRHTLIFHVATCNRRCILVVYKYTMTKTQRQTIKSVAEIVAVRGSQPLVAKDIGASLNTVKSWTRKKNPLKVSRAFKTRILAAYGAKIDDGGRLFSIVNGMEQPFTKQTFESWRDYLSNAKRPFYSGNSIVSYFVGRGCDSISRIFWAASEKDNGRSDKFFAIVESFNQWAESTIKDFKLSKSNQFHSRYQPMMKTVMPEKNLPPNFAANFVIQKGSPRHNAHIEYLKTAAKKGDKAAIANLKQHGIEADKTAENMQR